MKIVEYFCKQLSRIPFTKENCPSDISKPFILVVSKVRQCVSVSYYYFFEIASFVGNVIIAAIVGKNMRFLYFAKI